jgi:hypothetical protein
MPHANTKGHLKIGSWQLVIGYSFFKGIEVGGAIKLLLIIYLEKLRD